MLPLCFFISGASGLLYELVCSRLLVFAFGATPHAVACTLCVFMGGMGLGAYVFGKLGIGKRNPAVAYALIELGIGLYGMLLPFLLAAGNVQNIILALAPGGLTAEPAASILRILVAGLFLLVPTVLMGAALPVLSWNGKASDRAIYAGRLYAVNTAGAVIGTILGAFLLIPGCGLRMTAFVAAALNLLVASVAAYSGRRGSVIESNVDAAVAETGVQVMPASPAVSPAKAALIVGFAAALSMALQVIWTRLFSLVVGASVYAFSIVLAVCLLGIAVGSFLVSTNSKKFSNPLSLSAVSLGAALSLYVGIWFVSQLPWILISEGQFFWNMTGGYTFAEAMVSRAVLSGAFMLLPSILLGSIFPAALLLFGREPQQLSKSIGVLYGANTLGAICGSLAAGFLMITGLSEIFPSGLQASLLVITALLLGLSLFCLPSTVLSKRLAAGLAACAWLGVSVGICFIRPPWEAQLMTSGVSFYQAREYARLGYEDFRRRMGLDSSDPGLPEVLLYREGLNTTISVTHVPNLNIVFLKNDGKVEAVAIYDPNKSGQPEQMSTQVLLGELPLLLSRRPASNALLIGYGSGITAGSMLRHDELKHLVIAELEPAVFDADGFFNEENNRPLRPMWKNSGRVTPVCADARTTLSEPGPAYDVIVSQPSDPWVNGASSLFTREFWQLAKRRLSTEGIFCQWIQLYGITPEYLGVLCSTFQAVFPESLVFNPKGSAELILVGFAQKAQIDRSELDSRFAVVADDLSRVGVKSSEDLLGTLVSGPAELAQLRRKMSAQYGSERFNTDDNLLTEYQLPKQLFAADRKVDENLAVLVSPTFDRNSLLTSLLRGNRTPD